MSRYLIDRIAALPNVTLYTGAEVIALEGDETGALCKATFRGARFRKLPDLSVAAPVPVHRRRSERRAGSPSASRWTTRASSSPARDFAPTDLPIGRAPLPLETSVAGVFAIGDVRAGSTKRVGAAIGEGAAVVAQNSRGAGELGASARCEPQPRPTNGMPFAITVMNSTLVSSGRLAI